MMGYWPFSGDNSNKESIKNPTLDPVSENVPSKPFNPDEYDPRGPQKKEQILQQAVGSISSKDFAFGNLVKIPCFRDAGLVGLSSLGVVSTIIFLVHKNPTRAANWGVGAGLLGSLVGWEQCRFQRKRSFENVEKAKAKMKNKPRAMINRKHEENNNNNNNE